MLQSGSKDLSFIGHVIRGFDHFDPRQQKHVVGPKLHGIIAVACGGRLSTWAHEEDFPVRTAGNSAFPGIEHGLSLSLLGL